MTSISSIPTHLLLQPSRQAISEGQRLLAQAQAESSSGRHYDMGLALGSRTGADIALRLHLSSLDQASAGASQADLKADTTQEALSSLSSLADRFRSTLTGARSAEDGRRLGTAFAQTSIGTMHDALSVTQDGQYLFAGLATDTPPLKDYQDGPRQAVVDAFQATFGFLPDDPAATNLTVTQVNDFVQGSLGPLFSGVGWTSTWSSASDETARFRLPTGASADLATTANAPFAQKLAQAFSMIDVLGSSKINGAAYSAVVDSSLSLVSVAQLAIGDEQARIGIGQAQLKEAQSSIQQQKTSLTAAISAFESVDPYEAATRVNLLMTQLEGSYSLTGRISKMSLLSYI